MSESTIDRLIQKYSPLFEREFVSKQTNKSYTFIGILRGNDDIYYALLGDEGNLLLSSCVGHLDGGYELMEEVKP